MRTEWEWLFATQFGIAALAGLARALRRAARAWQVYTAVGLGGCATLVLAIAALTAAVNDGSPAYGIFYEDLFMTRGAPLLFVFMALAAGQALVVLTQLLPQRIDPVGEVQMGDAATRGTAAHSFAGLVLFAALVPVLVGSAFLLLGAATLPGFRP